METNKVELTGIIGNIREGQFSLCVQEVITSINGDIIVDQTWLPIRYIHTEQLSTNVKVNVIGKLHMQGYIDSEGNDRKCLEVIANQVNKV